MNRNSKIMERLQEHYDYIKDKYDVVCLMLQGSQNYELDIYNDKYISDIDSKAIILPSFKDTILNNKPISTTIILPNNEHIDVKDIRIMSEVYQKMNINFIETLFTEFKVINPVYGCIVKELFDSADIISKINTNRVLRCISGMSKEKLNALKHPYPTTINKIEKYGYDPKQLHHIVRMNYFIKEYIKDYNYKKCLIPTEEQKKYLIDIKTGMLSLKDAEALAYDFDNETYQLKQSYMVMPEIVNQDGIDILNNVKYNLFRYKFKNELKDG